MKGIFTFFFLALSILSIAQSKTTESTHIDARLLVVFEEKYLHTLQSENPSLLKRLHFYLDHAYYIADYPSEKGNPGYPEIVIPQLENINIFLLEKENGMKRDFDQQMKFQIAGTGKVLVYYSGKEFTKKLNAYLNRR